MMRKVHKIIAIIITLAISLSLFISNRYNSDSNASEVTASAVFNDMGAGWNLGNSLDSYYEKGAKPGEANLGQETIWGNPKVSKELIDYVARLGFKTVRVPVTWFTHTYRDENGVIHINQQWLSRVREVVDYCLADGLYVIINTHHDESIIYTGVSDQELQQVKADCASLWTEIAATFNYADHHLIFESYNEVDNNEKYFQFGKKAASQMNELNQVFVDTVRKSGGNNAVRVLMVPTLLDGRTSDFIDAFVMPRDPVKDRILLTMHCYSQQYDQSIENSFAEMEKLSKKTGAKVVIGEWGTKSKYSPSQFRGIHAANYVARAAAHGMKCIYWDNGSDYAIIDRKNLSCNQDMVNAILNPSPYTSDGTEVNITQNDFTYMTINQETGELKKDAHWGTIILGQKGQIDVPAGAANVYVQLTRSGSMSTQAIHYVYFFDASGNVLSKVNEWNGFTEKTVSIPAGCSYVRIGINSAYTATSKAEYSDALGNGELVPYIRFTK